MTDTPVLTKPRTRRRPLRKIDAAMRQRIEAAIERMIEALDAVEAPVEDREPEDEGDGEVDDEPSLGAAETMNQSRSWSYGQNPARDDCEQQDEDGDELDRAEVSDLEISGEADGDSGGIVDDEPSLGSLDGRMSQLRWSIPDRSVWWPNQDMELDEAEQEVGIEDSPHDAE